VGQMPARTGELNRGRCSGFTLLELLTSLVVISVAVTLFMGMFTASLAMAKQNASQRIAAGLAEERLTEILIHPNQYQWPDFSQEWTEALLPLTTEVLGRSEPPNAMPTERSANDRVRLRYEDVTWRAFTRLPARNADYAEVVVEVTWTQHGRPRSLALTSALPRSSVEGGS